MTSTLINDRNRLIRYSDRDSEANYKIRLAAGRIIVAICEAFLPSAPPFVCDLLLGDDCILEIGHAAAGPRILSVKVSMRIRDGSSNYVELFKRISLSGNLSWGRRDIPLDAARVIADRITEGWLQKVLKQFEREHGRDAAAKLAEELGLPLHDPIPPPIS